MIALFICTLVLALLSLSCGAVVAMYRHGFFTPRNDKNAKPLRAWELPGGFWMAWFPNTPDEQWRFSTDPGTLAFGGYVYGLLPTLCLMTVVGSFFYGFQESVFVSVLLPVLLVGVVRAFFPC